MTVNPLEPTTGSKAFRNQIGSALKSALGSKWVVFPQTAPTNQVTKPTVILERTAVDRGQVLGMSKGTYSLIVISDQVIADNREDHIDDLLDQVISALDGMSILWSNAQRGVWNDANYCYSLTLTATNNRTTDN